MSWPENQPPQVAHVSQDLKCRRACGIIIDADTIKPRTSYRIESLEKRRGGRRDLKLSSSQSLEKRRGGRRDLKLSTVYLERAIEKGP